MSCQIVLLTFLFLKYKASLSNQSIRFFTKLFIMILSAYVTISDDVRIVLSNRFFCSRKNRKYFIIKIPVLVDKLTNYYKLLSKHITQSLFIDSKIGMRINIDLNFYKFSTISSAYDISYKLFY